MSDIYTLLMEMVLPSFIMAGIALFAYTDFQHGVFLFLSGMLTGMGLTMTVVGLAIEASE